MPATLFDAVADADDERVPVQQYLVQPQHGFVGSEVQQPAAAQAVVVAAVAYALTLCTSIYYGHDAVPHMAVLFLEMPN